MSNINGKQVFKTSRIIRTLACPVGDKNAIYVGADALLLRDGFDTGVFMSHGMTNRIVVDNNGIIYVATGAVEQFDSDGKPINIFKGPESESESESEYGATVYGLAITSCGNFICSGGTGGIVWLWNVENGELVRIFDLNSDGVAVTVFTVAFSPDGKIICSGSSDNTVRLWNVETGECISTLNGHTNFVRSVAFSPDGEYVCSGSYDKTVRLWNVETGECVHKLEHNGHVNIVAFSPDGKYMCSGAGVAAAVYSTTSWKQLYILNTEDKGAVKDIAVSPEGKIYTASVNGKVMCFIPSI